LKSGGAVAELGQHRNGAPPAALAAEGARLEGGNAVSTLGVIFPCDTARCTGLRPRRWAKLRGWSASQRHP